MNNQEIGISLFSLSGLAMFIVIPVLIRFGVLEWKVFAYTVVQPPNYYINFIWSFCIVFFTAIRWHEARRWMSLGSMIVASTILIIAFYIATNSAMILKELDGWF
jgi:hypothetical protein